MTDEKKRVAVLIAASAVLVGSFFFAETGKERVTSLTRSPYGSGDAIYQFQVRQEEEVQDIQITVKEMEPDGKDWEKRREKAIQYAREAFLSEVAELSPENPVLDLPEQYGDCEITWKSLSQPAADDGGYVWFALLESSKLTYECAVALGEFRESFLLEAEVPYKEEKENIENLLQEQIDRQDGKLVMLPDQLEGKEIQVYRSSGSLLYLPALGSGMILLWQLLLKDLFIKKQGEKRIRKIQKEFPLFLSKLILYLRAGMSVRSAWDRLTFSLEKNRPKSLLLQEMLVTKNQIYSGVGEGRAYEEFGIRCEKYSYKRVGMLLAQAVEKNGETLIAELEEELEHFYLEEKNQARKKGEEAGTKLLLPTGIQFVFLMLTMMIPALLQFEI